MVVREKIDSTTPWLAVIAITSTALLTFANYCGLGFTSDSYRYIEIAQQIGDSGFWLAEGFYTKPPLYPLLIHWVGSESIFAINVVCLLISLCALYYLGTTLSTKFFRWLFWTISLFSTPTLCSTLIRLDRTTFH